MARTELPNGVILPAEYSDDWYEDMTSNLTKLDDVIGSDSEKLNADGVYFLRMSSAALTDSGTGNFSDLNSSYKIKTGDLVLDSGRKLYRIVSVDSTNETFTVGNSLFKVTAESDLAAVATSGDYGDLDNKPNLNPYDQHLANTDIHVTASDKTKWNNGVTQAYVLRYSSTAITDNSTIAYSTLDNTDNIKANDKIIDVDGKIFSVVSVDSDNSTVTVGTALIDLALDSDVVHKDGNEYILGVKSFLSTPYIYNPDVSSSTPNLNLRNSKVTKGTTTDNGSQIIQFLDKDLKYLAQVIGNKLSNGSTAIKFNVGTLDGNAQSISAEIQLFIAVNGEKSFIPSNDNDVALGKSLNRCKGVNTYLVNGLTPSSLSMPTDNIANIIDISGYLTVLDGSQANTYQAPANGWISITMRNSLGIQAYINGLWGHQIVRPSVGGVRFLMPVLKNLTANILIFNGSIDNARFIPCQGNI